MNTCRVTLRLAPYYPAFLGYRVLGTDALMESLPGVIAHEITGTPWGEIALDVRLKRASHEEVLNELLAFVQRYGYALVNGEISKLVSSAVEGAILTGLGGGAVGAASESPLVTALTAFFGAVIGGFAGSQIERVEAVYQVQPNFGGSWCLTPVSQPGNAPSPRLAGA